MVLVFHLYDILWTRVVDTSLDSFPKIYTIDSVVLIQLMTFEKLVLGQHCWFSKYSWQYYFLNYLSTQKIYHTEECPEIPLLLTGNILLLFFRYKHYICKKKSVYTNTDNSREQYSTCVCGSLGVSFCRTIASHFIAFFPPNLCHIFSVIYLSWDELTWLEHGADNAKVAGLILVAAICWRLELNDPFQLRIFYGSVIITLKFQVTSEAVTSWSNIYNCF